MKKAVIIAAILASAAAGQSLSGVIDLHLHCDPDSVPRSIDAIDVAKLAKSRGMRGFVLKNHWDPTAGIAYLVRKEVPGIEVFGGIVLNRSVGGINPAAVEHMTQVKGGFGRVVWMPTSDAENAVRAAKSNRPFVPISRNGALLPEVKQMLALIARLNLTLATGHSSAAEDLLLVRAARAAGIRKIIITHAMIPPVSMSVAQMKEAGAEGAYVEFVYHALLTKSGMTIGGYADAIRAIGPEHCVLSSDLGQANFPLHPDGLVTFFKELRAHGITQAQIDLMSKTNPARALGLQ
ncbi:MAG TPA: DUF6282 family protein [Bryobacteraceae bacterium]|nr:DUF6282 family protein [Bryobacteraceae bacterium]